MPKFPIRALLAGVVISLYLFAQGAWSPDLGNPQSISFKDTQGLDDKAFWTSELGPEGVLYQGRSKVWMFREGEWKAISDHDFDVVRDLLFDQLGNLWVLGVDQIGYFERLADGSLDSEFVSRKEELFKGVEVNEEFWSFQKTSDALFVACRYTVYKVTEGEVQSYFFNSGNVVRHYFLPVEDGLLGGIVGEAPVLISANGVQNLFADTNEKPESIMGIFTLGDGYLLSSASTLYGVDEEFERVYWQESLDLDILEDKQYLHTYSELIDGSIFAMGTFGDGLLLFDLQGNLLTVLDDSNALLNDKVFWVEKLGDESLVVSTSDSTVFINLNKPIGEIGKEAGLVPSMPEAVHAMEGGFIIDTRDGLYELSITSDSAKIRNQFLDKPAIVVPFNGTALIANHWWIEQLDLTDGALTDLKLSEEGSDVLTFRGSSDWSEIGVVNTKLEFAIYAATATGGLERVSPLFPVSSTPILMETDFKGGFFMGYPDRGLTHIKKVGSHYEVEKIESIQGVSLLDASIDLIKSSEHLLLLSHETFALYNPQSRRFEWLSTPPLPGPVQAFNYQQTGSSGTILAVVTNPEFNSQLLVSYELEDAGVWKTLPVTGIDRIGRVQFVTLPKNSSERILLTGLNGNLLLDYANLPALPDLPMPQLNSNIDQLVVKGESSEVPFENAGIHFSYFVPRVNPEIPLLYETRLVGSANSEWTRLGNSGNRGIGQLFEGDYEFQVRAIDPLGRVSAATTVEFAVLPPWYRSPLAYGTYTALLVLSIMGFIRIRERRLTQEKLLLEQTVALRTEELLRANHFKDEFIANMSHEIRNPLNGVIGLIRRLSPHQPTPARYLSALQNAASYLQTTVEEILDFSKIESGEITVDEHIFDPESVVDIVMDIYAQKASRKGIPVYKAASLKPGLKIVSDSSKIQQIFGNLLGNAVKFTERGSITVGMSVKEHVEGKGFLKFWVTDTGVGIQPSEIEKVFDKFYQTAEGKRQTSSGTGLGLALCKRFAEVMNGGISVDSVYGEGSTFSVSIPVKIEYQTIPQLEPTSNFDIPLRVLLVEDLEYNRLFIEDLLKERNCEVTASPDAIKAIKEVKANEYDLIITDWDLPELTGLDFVRILRRDNLVSDHTLILGMTAFATEATRKACLEAGMDDFITKPLRVEQLDQFLIRLRSDLSTKRDPKESVVDVSSKTKPEFEGRLIDGLGLLRRMKGSYGNGGGKLENRYLQFYCEYKKELADAIESLQVDQIRAAAHRFLGHLRMIEAPYPSGVIADLLTSAQAGDLESCQVEFKVFEGIEDDFVDEIKELLKSKPQSNE